jgi:hypothetical protein
VSVTPVGRCLVRLAAEYESSALALDRTGSAVQRCRPTSSAAVSLARYCVVAFVLAVTSLCSAHNGAAQGVNALVFVVDTCDKARLQDVGVFLEVRGVCVGTSAVARKRVCCVATVARATNRTQTKSRLVCGVAMYLAVRVLLDRCAAQHIYALPDFWGLPLLVVGNKSGRWDALTAHAVRCAQS